MSIGQVKVNVQQAVYNKLKEKFEGKIDITVDASVRADMDQSWEDLATAVAETVDYYDDVIMIHDHSTDDLGGKLKQINTHEEGDLDESVTSWHHTLGTTEFQAAPGNHDHDTAYSSISHTHDGTYPPYVHTHAATDITSGTLNNLRFSAYSNLSDELKIGTGATQVAAGDHNHDAAYSAIGHSHTTLDDTVALLNEKWDTIVHNSIDFTSTIAPTYTTLAAACAASAEASSILVLSNTIETVNTAIKNRQYIMLNNVTLDFQSCSLTAIGQRSRLYGAAILTGSGSDTTRAIIAAGQDRCYWSGCNIEVVPAGNGLVKGSSGYINPINISGDFGDFKISMDTFTFAKPTSGQYNYMAFLNGANKNRLEIWLKDLTNDDSGAGYNFFGLELNNSGHNIIDCRIEQMQNSGVASSYGIRLTGAASVGNVFRGYSLNAHTATYSDGSGGTNIHDQLVS